MMRRFPSFLVCLSISLTVAEADVLINTRAPGSTIIEPDESYVLDLGDHFQLYGDPGPVVNFDFSMPVQTGFMDLLYRTTGVFEPDYDPEGPTEELMTYELADGGSYNHVFDPSAVPANFAWQQYTVQFQLRGDLAPGTVSNFVQYTNVDAYDKVIVHRAEIGVVQSGRYRVSDSPDFLLTQINTRGFIEFEETIANARGTLAMARGGSLNSASSEFFINLVDNSDTLRTAYSVFGEVMNFETNMPILEQMREAYIWDLSGFFGAVFRTVPLYSPIDAWKIEGKDNYLRFDNISVPEGTRSGVTYTWEFGDLDGVEGTSDEESANQDAFDVVINNGQLEISRSDTGQVLLEVTGTSGGQTSSFSFFVTGYNSQALAAFPNFSVEQDGYLDSSWYGLMKAETYPEIVHDNHGQQWVYYGTGASDFPTFFYIYDAKLQSWIYTTPVIYPLMYIYGWETWTEYAETTGNGTDVPRWFYNFTTTEWVTD